MYKFTNKKNAENFRDRAFETNGKSLIIIFQNNYYLVCFRKDAQYEVENEINN